MSASWRRDDFENDGVGKSRPLSDLASEKGDAFHYGYDFGSTTCLRGQVVATLDGVPRPRGGLRLVARNQPPDHSCTKCDAPATAVCQECGWGSEALYCARHFKDHEHGDDDMHLPVVNSPRMGVCGYVG